MAAAASLHILLLPAAMFLLHVLFFLPARRLLRPCRYLRAREWCFGKQPPNAKLQKLLLAKRRGAWQEFMQHVRHVSALYWCVKALRLVTGTGSAPPLCEATRLLLFHVCVQLFCCFYVGLPEDTGLARFCGGCCRCWHRDGSPYLERARMPSVAYLFCQGLVETSLALQEATESMSEVALNNASFMVRITLCVVNKRLDQAVIVNGFLAALTIYRRAQSPSSDVVLVQLLEFISTVIVSAVLERLLVRETLRELEAKDSRSVESSIEQMLCGVCDAVVHLDKDLALKRRSPQLDALLLRSAQGGQANGKQAFLDLLHEDSDKEAFRGFIRAGVQAGSLPGTLHVAMRDANQMPVPVQVFHTQYVDAADELFHIIGLREFGDGEVRQQSDLEEPPACVDFARTLRHRPSSQAAISELSSQLSDVEVLPQVPPDEGEPDEVAVWVEPFKKQWPMCQCTQAFFASIGGPSLKRGTRLIDWVPRHQRETVEGQLQQRLNQQLLGSALDELGEDDGGLQVCLRPSHMAGRSIHARVTISAPQRALGEDSDGCASDNLSVKITCTRLRIVHPRSADPELQQAPQPSQGSAARASLARHQSVSKFIAL